LGGDGLLWGSQTSSGVNRHPWGATGTLGVMDTFRAAGTFRGDGLLWGSETPFGAVGTLGGGRNHQG